jgi:hypothetical protein
VNGPLVFYDQVQNGVVRFELSGDIKAAMAHVRDGRRLLGQMRAYTGLPDLEIQGLEATGGSGFWHAPKRLADGTVIHVMHNDGQEVVRIDSPPQAAQHKEKPPKIVEPYIATFEGACGSFGGPDSSMPWVWKRGPNFGYSYPEGHDFGFAVGISWDADHACGYFKGNESDDDDYNFRWTRRNGTFGETENLGPCVVSRDDNMHGYATSISGDGRVIGTTRGWYWSRSRDWQRVNLNELTMGPNEHGSAQIMAISGDGKYMGGRLGVDNGFGGEFLRPVIWTSSGEGPPVPNVLDDGGATWQSVSVAGLTKTATRVVLASGESETLNFVYSHYEGHERVAGYQVSNTGGQSPLVAQYDYPLEPYVETNFTSFGPTLEEGGIFTTEGVLFDVVITHQEGGAVTGVRYDGSAACGWIAAQDEPGFHKAAYWGSDMELHDIGRPDGFTMAEATGISQSGDVVLSGWGVNAEGELRWWWWSEGNGFFIASETVSMGLCISQDGAVTGGFHAGAGPGELSEGIPAKHGRANSDMSDFDVSPQGDCAALTRLTIYMDENGDISYVPPMPGLRLVKDKTAMYPLGPRPDFR